MYHILRVIGLGEYHVIRVEGQRGELDRRGQPQTGQPETLVAVLTEEDMDAIGESYGDFRRAHEHQLEENRRVAGRVGVPSAASQAGPVRRTGDADYPQSAWPRAEAARKAPLAQPGAVIELPKTAPPSAAAPEPVGTAIPADVAKEPVPIAGQAPGAPAPALSEEEAARVAAETGGAPGVEATTAQAAANAVPPGDQPPPVPQRRRTS